MRPMTGLNKLRDQNKLTWIAQEHGWVATPEDIVTALSSPAGGRRLARCRYAHGIGGLGDLGDSPGPASSHRFHFDRWGVAQGRPLRPSGRGRSV